jgi:Uma2 family endonuclease
MTEPLITAEDLLRTPDLGRCELVRGRLIRMAFAGAEHGAIACNIGAPLGLHVSQAGLGCVFGGGTGFHIEHNPSA